MASGCKGWRYEQKGGGRYRQVGGTWYENGVCVCRAKKKNSTRQPVPPKNVCVCMCVCVCVCVCARARTILTADEHYFFLGEMVKKSIFSHQLSQKVDFILQLPQKNRPPLSTNASDIPSLLGWRGGGVGGTTCRRYRRPTITIQEPMIRSKKQAGGYSL